MLHLLFLGWYLGTAFGSVAAVVYMLVLRQRLHWDTGREPLTRGDTPECPGWRYSHPQAPGGEPGACPVPDCCCFRRASSS